MRWWQKLNVGGSKNLVIVRITNLVGRWPPLLPFQSYVIQNYIGKMLFLTPPILGVPISPKISTSCMLYF